MLDEVRRLSLEELIGCEDSTKEAKLGDVEALPTGAQRFEFEIGLEGRDEGW